MSLVLAVLFMLVPVMGDGFPNDEDIPATFSANRVVGDVYPQGADLPGQQFVDTISRVPLLSLNSDPSAGDVGFGSGLQRGIQTGVLNGDFSMLPPDVTEAISDSNPLPYWTWEPDGGGNAWLSMIADTSYASGYRLSVQATAAGAETSLYQFVPVPRSGGQQYRVLLSGLTGGASVVFGTQFYDKDLAAIGSEVLSANAVPVGVAELKLDVGLVTPTAAYLKVRLRVTPTSGGFAAALGEVRVAFLPAEATVGLGSLSTSTGAITTTETQVKGITIPANTLVPGSVYAIEAWATVTSSAANNVTLRIRLGTTTLTGTILDNINPTATTTASADPFMLRGIVTVYTVGATGTVQVGLSIVGSNTQPFSVPVRTDMPSAAITIDTTVAKILELTAQTGAGTTSVNFRHAVISCLMAS